MLKFLSYLFGCRHARYGFPRTIRTWPRPAAAVKTGTYVVCLECGHEMPYDWQRMKIVRPGAPQSWPLPAQKDANGAL